MTDEFMRDLVFYLAGMLIGGVIAAATVAPGLIR